VAQNESQLAASNKPEYQGPFDTKDGVWLVPEGLPYSLSFSTPGDFIQNPPVAVHVLIKRGDESVVDMAFGGPERKGGFSQLGRRASYDCGSHKLQALVAGEVVTTVLTDNGASNERVYKVVSLKEYEAAWDGWRNPIIERYKRRLIAEVTNTARRYWSVGGDQNKSSQVKAGQKVAAFIEGRWLEGTFEQCNPEGEQIVRVVTVAGPSSYVVGLVLPLEEALTEGLHVVPPYSAQSWTGSEARLLDSEA
jgi:hypothetical protein